MASKGGPRYVVAVADDWRSVLAAPMAIQRSLRERPPISVLAPWSAFPAAAFSEAGAACEPGLRQALEAPAQLVFAEAPTHLGCTAGGLARQIARRIDQGCPSLSSALGVWMLKKQADRFARDLQDGRLLLWVSVRSPEEEMATSAVLLGAGTARVEVHDLVPVARLT